MHQFCSLRSTRSSLLLTSFLAIAMSPVSLSAQGSMAVWGPVGFSTPVSPNFAQTDTGYFFAVTLLSDQSILVHGEGTAGSSDDWGLVADTPTGTGFVQVAAATLHAMALRSDGSIESWGRDHHGQVAGTPASGSFVQIAAGAHFSCALGSDGSIVSWGLDDVGQVSATPTAAGFTQIAAGSKHCLALRADGSIVGWGLDDFGQVSNAPAALGFVKIATGATYSMALRADGSIISWGDDSEGQVSDTPLGVGFTQLDCGAKHSIAVRADGTLASWGSDLIGAVSGTPGGSGYFDVSADGYYSVALRAEDAGSAYCFGDGTGTACPCSGSGVSGAGCQNSTGPRGATLQGAGVASYSDDNFRFLIGGLPAQSPGLMMIGANQLNSGLGNPVGAGLLCLGGQAMRSQVQNSTPAGFAYFVNFHNSGFGNFTYGLGVPVNYQFWYRDPANPCLGAGFNFSNAWTTAWAL